MKVEQQEIIYGGSRINCEGVRKYKSADAFVERHAALLREFCPDIKEYRENELTELWQLCQLDKEKPNKKEKPVSDGNISDGGLPATDNCNS